MKKYLLFFSFLLFLFGCTNKNAASNCIRPFSIVINKSLDNPDMNNVLTDRGYTTINGGFKGILILNKGLDKFVAFDRICPNNDCDSQMSIETTLGLILKCKCDRSEYSVDLGGSPQTKGFECPAIEYKATKIGRTIQITNF